LREITSHGGAEAEVFLGAGHFPFNDDPERFVAVLNDFVASTRPAELGQGQIEPSSGATEARGPPGGRRASA